MAKTETLFDDLLTALGEQRLVLEKSFVIGVNTICFCHRARKQMDCALTIFRLITPGGVCVVIVMNGRFPVFRVKLNNAMRAESRREEE